MDVNPYGEVVKFSVDLKTSYRNHRKKRTAFVQLTSKTKGNLFFLPGTIMTGERTR